MLRYARVVGLALAVTASGLAGDVPAGAQAGGSDATGSAGYAERVVFAGYEDHPVAVAAVTVERRPPTRWCVHWRIEASQVYPDFDTLTPDFDHMTAEDVVDIARRWRGPFEEGREYELFCYRTGEQHPYLITRAVYHERQPTGGEITTIETVEEFAKALVAAQAVGVRIAPPPERLVVGFETQLALAAPIPPAQYLAQAGPFWARAELLPATITYDMGDGGAVTCAIDEPAGCGRYTYESTRSDRGLSHPTITATVTYDVWLTTSEQPQRRRADTFAGPPTTIPATLREVQAVVR